MRVLDSLPVGGKTSDVVDPTSAWAVHRLSTGLAVANSGSKGRRASTASISTCDINGGWAE